MLAWHQYTLIIILALLLTACGMSDSTTAMSVPTGMPPTAAQRATPAESGAVHPTDIPNTNVMPNTPPKTCPVTRPQAPRFTPPAPYPRYAPSPDSFWYGTDTPEEPEPHLVMMGRRLDATAPPLDASRATNAFAEDIQSAMLVGVGFPTLGCWELTGRYAGAELSFVVWVAP